MVEGAVDPARLAGSAISRLAPTHHRRRTLLETLTQQVEALAPKERPKVWGR